MAANDQKTACDLRGRTAIVTGAGTGIGQATAVALAEAGAFVTVHYATSRAGAVETLTRIQQAGGKGQLCQADLTSEVDAQRVVAETLAATGRIDILFNNAGSLLQRSSIADCSLELWQAALNVNVTSAFLITRAAIPALKQSGRGSIINNLSLSVQTGGSGGAGPYAAAKGALLVFTRTLARELAPQVRANSLMPGVVETPHHEIFTTPEKMEDYRRQTPLGRNAQSDEIAQAVLFLASDASSFMTGGIIDLNGGRFLR